MYRAVLIGAMALALLTLCEAATKIWHIASDAILTETVESRNCVKIQTVSGAVPQARLSKGALEPERRGLPDDLAAAVAPATGRGFSTLARESRLNATLRHVARTISASTRSEAPRTNLPPWCVL